MAQTITISTGEEVRAGDTGLLKTRKGEIPIIVSNIGKWIAFLDLNDGNKRKDTTPENFIANFKLVKPKSGTDSSTQAPASETKHKPIAPAPDNNALFKVGERVKVIDKMMNYRSYPEKFKEMGLKFAKNLRVPLHGGEEGVVLAISTDKEGNTIYGVNLDNQPIPFIIGEKGLAYFASSTQTPLAKQNGFQIGQRVKVIDSGFHYTAYYQVFKEMGLRLPSTPRGPIANGAEGRILAKSIDFSGLPIYGVKLDSQSLEVVVGGKGLEAINTPATTFRFEPGKIVSLKDIGEQYTNWFKMFEKLGFEEPSTERVFLPLGEQLLITKSFSDPQRGVLYAAKTIETGYDCLLTEDGLEINVPTESNFLPGDKIEIIKHPTDSVIYNWDRMFTLFQMQKPLMPKADDYIGVKGVVEGIFKDIGPVRGQDVVLIVRTDIGEKIFLEQGAAKLQGSNPIKKFREGQIVTNISNGKLMVIKGLGFATDPNQTDIYNVKDLYTGEKTIGFEHEFEILRSPGAYNPDDIVEVKNADKILYTGDYDPEFKTIRQVYESLGLTFPNNLFSIYDKRQGTIAGMFPWGQEVIYVLQLHGTDEKLLISDKGLGLVQKAKEEPQNSHNTTPAQKFEIGQIVRSIDHQQREMFVVNGYDKEPGTKTVYFLKDIYTGDTYTRPENLLEICNFKASEFKLNDVVRVVNSHSISLFYEGGQPFEIADQVYNSLGLKMPRKQLFRFSGRDATVVGMFEWPKQFAYVIKFHDDGRKIIVLQNGLSLVEKASGKGKNTIAPNLEKEKKQAAIYEAAMAVKPLLNSGIPNTAEIQLDIDNIEQTFALAYTDYLASTKPELQQKLEEISEFSETLAVIPSTSQDVIEELRQKIETKKVEIQEETTFSPGAFFDKYYIAIQQNIPDKLVSNPMSNPRFKAWFAGSKVVDANGNPLPVYHGTGGDFSEFTSFKFNLFPGAYFAENRSYSEWFANMKGNPNKYLYTCYLNVSNPIDLRDFVLDKVTYEDFILYVKLRYNLELPEMKNVKAMSDAQDGLWAWQYLRNAPGWLKFVNQKTNFDGFTYYENNPGDKDDQGIENITPAWMILQPSQVKTADTRNTTYSIFSDNILMKKGGKI